MLRLPFVAVAVLVTVLPRTAAAQDRNEGQRHPKLWAALTVPQPVILKNQINDLTLTFAIVNDSDSTVNPAFPNLTCL